MKGLTVATVKTWARVRRQGEGDGEAMGARACHGPGDAVRLCLLFLRHNRGVGVGRLDVRLSLRQRRAEAGRLDLRRKKRGGRGEYRDAASAHE